MLIKKILKIVLPKKFYFCIAGHNTFKKNWFLRFWAALHGFTIDEWVIFEFPKNNCRDYISEYDRFNFRKVALKYRIVFDNKMLFYYLMKDIAPLNRLFAHKEFGKYSALSDEFLIDNLLETLKHEKKIVYKPIVAGGGGRGFALIEYNEGGYYINRKSFPASEIMNMLVSTDNYMLEEYCVQSEFENNIFPDTVNTLRIITVEEKNEIQVVVVMQRLGSVKDSCADNASLGGLFCSVDIKTGVLSAAFSYSPDFLFDNLGQKQVFPTHPTTNNRLEGLVIPNFDYIKSEACRIHEAIRFTGAKFVAWDFALTEDGYRVIEGNTSSGMKFIQFHEGMKNKPLGKWMKNNFFI